MPDTKRDDEKKGEEKKDGKGEEKLSVERRLDTIEAALKMSLGVDLAAFDQVVIAKANKAAVEALEAETAEELA